MFCKMSKINFIYMMNVDQVLKLSGKWFSNKSSDNLSYLVQFHLEWVTLKIPWNDSTNISFPSSVEMFPVKTIHYGAIFFK